MAVTALAVSGQSKRAAILFSYQNIAVVVIMS